MFDELFQMIKQNGQRAVVENDQVPNEHNEGVLEEAHNAVASGLGNINNPDQANGLFESVRSGSPQSNPSVQHISDNFISKITQKFGISPGVASSIASALIPLVISQVVGKGNAQGGAGGLGGLLAGLTGGTSTQGGGLAGNISSMGSKIGLDKDGDGDVDLNDLTKMFK